MILISDKRICKDCGEEKKLSKFPSKVNKPTGVRYFQYRCNKCQYTLWLKKNIDSRDRYMKNQREKEDNTIDGRAMMLRNRCKCRAKKYNHEFDLSKEYIKRKLKKGICEQTKIKLELNGDRYNPYAPSIDRIDNSIGYIDSNIQIVCTIYNFCKNQFSDNDVYDFIRKAKANDIHPI